MTAWEQVAQEADGWVLAYASTPVFVPRVRLVLIGQALERYLQAAYLKLTHHPAAPGTDWAALLAACRQADPTFLPSYTLPRAWAALARQFPVLRAGTALAPSDLADLADLEETTGAEWMALLKAVRTALSYPTPTTEDVLEIAVRSHEYPAWATPILIQLYT